MFIASSNSQQLLINKGFNVTLTVSEDLHQITATKDNIIYTISIHDKQFGHIDVWHVVKLNGIIVDTQQQFYNSEDSVDYSDNCRMDLKKILYRNNL